MQTVRYSFLFLLALALISCNDSGTGSNPTFFDVSVSVTPGGAGTIAPAADSTYEAGYTVSLEATPADGFEFTGWSGDVESADNPLSLTVDQDYNLSANFTKETLFNVSVTVTPEGAGTITPAVDSAYAEGSMIDLEATAEEGFAFDGWTGDMESSDNPLSLTVDQDYSLTANFIDTDELFFLGENGVTVRCPEAEPGMKGDVNGTEYVAVDRDLLDEKFFDGADLSTVCTSPVTDLSSMFLEAEDFNQDISSWDVGNVTDMRSMFEEAFGFNQDISNWNTSSVTDMRRMFWSASSFNSVLNNWDVGNVASMRSMFAGAEAFNQDLNGWDTSSVTDMSFIFGRDFVLAGDPGVGATSFNGDISGWNVGNVTNMTGMFNLATSFNSDISGWDVSTVTNMRSMFAGAKNFNSDLSNWDVSNVTDMFGMFDRAAKFNSDISTWDVSNVTDMLGMFANAASFNQDLSNWDTGNITEMTGMFAEAARFNSNISGWDVSNVTRMGRMFENATSFNRDLSGWCVRYINSEPDNFSDGSALSEQNHPVWGTCPE